MAGMFCLECGALMFPKDGKLMCSRCGCVREHGSQKIRNRMEERDIIIDENVGLLPKTNVICPKCSWNEAYWVLLQTRSSDEPETRIYSCLKCKHRWREY